MTDLESMQATPLQKAFHAARRSAGKLATEMVLVAHGATTKHLDDVPQEQRASCLAALKRLTASATTGAEAERVGDDNDGTDAFAAVRERAYGSRERPTPVKKLDPVAIFQKWNSAVRPNED